MGDGRDILRRGYVRLSLFHWASVEVMLNENRTSKDGLCSLVVFIFGRGGCQLERLVDCSRLVIDDAWRGVLICL